MKKTEIDPRLSELDGDGASVFVDDGDDTETMLIITPNQWGTQNRDGRIALVMYEEKTKSLCGFELSAEDVHALILALREAADSSQ